MKRNLLKMLSVVLTVSMVFSFGTFFTSAQNNGVPTGGTTAVSWNTLYSSATKSGSKVTMTKNSSGSNVQDYDKYVNFKIANAETSAFTDAQYGYTNDSGFGISNGDVLLVHIIARSNPTTAKTGSIRFSMWKKASSGGNTNAHANAIQKTSISVPANWTEFYFPMVSNCESYNPTRICVFFGGGSKVVDQEIDIACLEVVNYKNTLTVSDLPSGSHSAKLKYSEVSGTVTPKTEGDSMNCYSDIIGEETTVSGIDGITKAKVLSNLNVYTFDSSVDDTYSNGDTLLFTFSFKALDKSSSVKITIKSSTTVSEIYYIPVQWTRVNIPLVISDLAGFELETDDNILIGEVKYKNYNNATIHSLDVLSGQHLLEDYESVALADNSFLSGSKPSTDIIRNGSYVYTIGDGYLTIFDGSNSDNPVKVGELGGLGNKIRQIALLDSTHVIITSRQDGAFIIDISTPSSPFICSRYDSVELATGLAVYDGYAFIANRQNGVEIVNAKDVEHPVQVAIVRDADGATVQSCTVYDGILYCGLWNEMRVDMYDVTKPDTPVLINKIDIHGKGDGVAVSKQNGKTLLYAATAQHGLKTTSDTSDDVTKIDFGQGNGFDIFDVTDAKNPVWLSTTRIDGRYYFANNDYWGVTVADGTDGKKYAYYYDTYVGTYVFDVTNPEAPIRASHITVKSEPGSPYYNPQDYNGRDEIFPYDQSLYTQSPIGSVICYDGVMYLASVFTGLHTFKADYNYTDAETTVGKEISKEDGSYYNFDGSDLSGFSHYRTSGQAYRAVSYLGKIYVACGYEGVLVFEESNFETPLKTITLDGCAADIEILNGKAYIAQKEAGLGIYNISSDGLTFTLNDKYESSRGVARDVKVSSTGKFVMVQVDASGLDIYNTSTKQCVLQSKANTQCYHRNILNGVINGRYYSFYVCANGNVMLYDFGENDSLDKPVVVKTFTTSKTAMQGAATVYDNKVLTTYDGGYYLFDILDSKYVSGGSLKALVGGKISDSAQAVYGLPQVYENTMILSDRIYGKVYIIDVTNIKSPIVKKVLNVSGNPDYALFTEDSIIIPMGYQGIFKFDYSQFDFTPEEEEHKHCICGGKVSGVSSHTCGETEFTPWTSSNSLPTTEGNYFLTRDVTISKQYSISTPEAVNLCLNGHTVTQTASSRVYGINCSDGKAELSICDCSASSGGNMTSVTGYTDHAAILQVTGNGQNVLNLYSGKVTAYTGTSSNKYGGAISADKGTFNIYSGTITGGTAGYGGALTVGGASEATVNMYGGTIIGSNVSTTDSGLGGGVMYLKGTGTFNLYGGTLSGGQAKYGGSILAAGEFNMYGGTVTGGIAKTSGATAYGGNFYLTSTGNVNLYGGTVEKGVAYGIGGNIASSAKTTATVTIDGAEVIGGRAKPDDTKQGGHGGNIYVNGTVNLVSGTVSGGVAELAGGGNISINGSTSTFNMSGGTVKNGKCPLNQNFCYAGNIYIWNNSSATANISGGEITYDSDYTVDDVKKCGGICLRKGILNLSGDVLVTDNIGANVYVMKDGVLNLQDLSGTAKVNVLPVSQLIGSAIANSDADYVTSGQIVCDAENTLKYSDGKIYIYKTADMYFAGTSLTLSSDISVNFYMYLTDVEAQSGTIVFKIGDRTVAGTVDKNENGYFFRCPVNSLEMATVVKAEFTLDGVTYTKQMSVDDYVQSILSGDYTEKDKALVKKVSNFGYYAQQYLQQQHKDVVIGKGGYAEMTLYPEADIDVSAAKEAVKDYAFTVSGENENIEKIERTLYLDDKIAMNFYVKVKNGYDLTDKVTVDGKDYSVTKSGTNEYKITVYDIEITDLDQDITVNADGQIITASVISYVNAVLSKDGISENSQNAMAALYEYHKAAKEY